MSKKPIKPMVSVSEMAKAVDLSRSRFYQLRVPLKMTETACNYTHSCYSGLMGTCITE